MFNPEKLVEYLLTITKCVFVTEVERKKIMELVILLVGKTPRLAA